MAIFAQSPKVDRPALPAQSSILEARAEPISDKKLPTHKNSLFDAIPFA
jgi:hypothetical protein